MGRRLGIIILAISAALLGMHQPLQAAQKEARKDSGKADVVRVSGAAAQDSSIRRVVTGKDTSGKAVVVMDKSAPVAVKPERGGGSALLWVTDSTPADVSGNGDAADRKIGTAPPANGTVFRVIDFLPEKSITADYETRLRAMKESGLEPEGPTRDHPRDPGMHRTRTIDYAVVLSGEIDMLLDDSEVHLKAGDVLVQRATNHAWLNRGDKPCRVAFVLIDAKD